MGVYKVQPVDACDKSVDARETKEAVSAEVALRNPILRRVPEKPTMAMLAAGSAAGRVTVETAWNIWQAMLKAAS